MTRRITTSIDIEAPAERVWSILMDFDAYPSWNPFILRLGGRPEPGKRLQVTIRPVGGRAMDFSPTVLAAEPGREFRWRGSVLVRGIFDGEHRLGVSPTSESTTHFEHGETFSGLLVRFVMRGKMLEGTAAGFEAMNRALKARAEGLAEGPAQDD